MILPPVLLAGAIPSLVPWPASYEATGGTFVLSSDAGVLADPKASKTAELLRRELGLRPDPRSTSRIFLRVDPSLGRLGPEGYRLAIGRSGILIASSSMAGLFYGGQTLRQMLPATAFRPGARFGSCRLPCSLIEDRPRFAWRGAHIDVARHFMPFPWLLKLVDLLALHKMNVLHLHLTDDQGWRMEVRRYPRLTSIGSKRAESEIASHPLRFDGRPHGGFYTLSQLRSLVAFAAKRHITVVPEIEMPGHSEAAIASYPELGNLGKKIPVATTWGIHKHVLNANDSTVRFYQRVLDEVMEVFPSRFIHVGGDEAPKAEWAESHTARAKIRSLGLRDEAGLQSWFIRQMDTYLARHGRRLIGWDEILQGGLAPGAAVMSWRGEEGGIAAANAGHDVVMAPSLWTYFDQAQFLDRKAEALRTWGYLSLERVYRYQPVPEGLDPRSRRHILGAESACWTEHMAGPGQAEYMMFPRLCALSEVLWSPSVTTYAGFRPRLLGDVARLDAMGVRHHSVDPVPPPRVGGWSRGWFGTQLVSHMWVVNREVTGPGIYKCQFQSYGGEHGLEIRKVELFEDGKRVVSDVHRGWTGNSDRANTYTLRLGRGRPGASYTVEAAVRTVGGTDSDGDVRFWRASSR